MNHKYTCMYVFHPAMRLIEMVRTIMILWSREGCATSICRVRELQFYGLLRILGALSTRFNERYLECYGCRGRHLESVCVR